MVLGRVCTTVAIAGLLVISAPEASSVSLGLERRDYVHRRNEEMTETASTQFSGSKQGPVDGNSHQHENKQWLGTELDVDHGKRRPPCDKQFPHGPDDDNHRQHDQHENKQWPGTEHDVDHGKWRPPYDKQFPHGPDDDNHHQHHQHENKQWLGTEHDVDHGKRRPPCDKQFPHGPDDDNHRQHHQHENKQWLGTEHDVDHGKQRPPYDKQFPHGPDDGKKHQDGGIPGPVDGYGMNNSAHDNQYPVDSKYGPKRDNSSSLRRLETV